MRILNLILFIFNSSYMILRTNFLINYKGIIILKKGFQIVFNRDASLASPILNLEEEF